MTTDTAEPIYWEGRKIRRGGMTLTRLEPVKRGPVCWLGDAQFTFVDSNRGSFLVRFTYKVYADLPAEAFSGAQAAADAEKIVVEERIKQQRREDASRIQVAGQVPPEPGPNPFKVQ